LKVSRRARRISIGLLLALAAGLLIGGVSSGRLSSSDEQTTTSEAATTAATVTDPYPLAASTTPKNVQLAVYERAYSECASSEPALLASKYKAVDTSKRGVAAAVGRAWASYFKAGRDAVQDGRDGCLQGQADRSK
jgi:ABC-type Fe3+-hydroxamate transport system substrate-binding protein